LLEGKNIAAVGYIKFKIVEKLAPTKSTAIAIDAFGSSLGYTVDCAATDITVKKLSWHDVEEQILAALNISKAEFEKDYSLDGGTSDATQYNGTTADSDDVTKDNDAKTIKVGKVSKTTYDTEDTQTEVLQWVVANNEAYQVLSSANTITVNVRFTKTVNAEKKVYEYVYVTFTWTPNPKNITPSGTIADGAKIDQYWYSKDAASQGYSDIHANVAQVKSSVADDCTFVSDILNTLVGNKITITNDDTYKAWAEAANSDNATIEFATVQDQLTAKKIGSTTYYTATGASGATYAIQGKGTSLQAAKIGADGKPGTFADIVTLAGTKGTELTYGDTEDALDLLNNADHNELAAGKTFTAKLIFKVTDPCKDGPTYKLTNDVFYAKFLRPVSAKPGQASELKDAENGASYTSLILNLVDWRDKKFDVAADYTAQNGTTMYNFYGFYGVTKVSADLANATTDLNKGTLGTTLLSKVTEQVKLYFGKDEESAVKVGNTGIVEFTYDTAETSATPTAEEPVSVTQPKFFYLNNGNTLGAFVVRVPLTVDYKWGKIYTYIDLKINQTINN
jgi:hypothetical protein